MDEQFSIGLSPILTGEKKCHQQNKTVENRKRHAKLIKAFQCNSLKKHKNHGYKLLFCVFFNLEAQNLL